MSDKLNESSGFKKSRGVVISNLKAGTEETSAGVVNELGLSYIPKVSRRKFLALLAASASFATAGCSSYRDKGEIIPYNREPVDVIPGISDYYASTCTGCSQACGILIKTREGRPIKVDGNPEHPVNRGKICARGQASILSLYDPERLRQPRRRVGARFSDVSWSDVDNAIIRVLNESVSTGKEIAIIAHTIISPTAKKVLDAFVSTYPTTKVYSYELFSNEMRTAAWRKSYGDGQFPLIRWEKAKIILALESDFLGTEGNVMEQMRMYALLRDCGNLKDFSRLYVVEGGMSVTGMNADYRIRLRPDAQFELVMSLLNEFVVQKGVSRFARNQRIVSILQEYSLQQFASRHQLDRDVLSRLASDLLDNRAASIVYAGDRLPEPVHIAVNFLNEVLDNAKLYRDEESVLSLVNFATKEDWETLIKNMRAGEVGVVIHYDSNPVYHLPIDFAYAEAIRKVPTVISLVQNENESSANSHWVLPINHDLESWNDFKTRTGLYSLQQPVIYPLYNTRQKEAVLLAWSSGDKSAYREDLYHEYLMKRWEEEVYHELKLEVDFKTFWYGALHDGVVSFKERTGKPPSFKIDSLYDLKPHKSGEGFIVLLSPSYALGDGRFSNNGWLQELPHPVSKVVWDNYAAVAPETASQLGLTSNDLIEIHVDGRVVILPVFIQFGMARDTIAIELGYGRSNAGTIGSGVGVNANVLMSKGNEFSPWIYLGAKVVKVPGRYELVSTLENHVFTGTLDNTMLFNRDIIREGTLEQYIKDPDFLKRGAEKEKPIGVYKEFEYKEVKWAMAIDLNKCTGCSVCVVACNVENNIPVVGKDQVAVGREMHWLRIDRYYTGTSDEPNVILQPMLCQQCDNAPCENVCPVAATTHSPDGLNMMTYNRCVGTRYCSNNCPYKVRRFNFFNFRDHFKNGYYSREPVEMLYNPEVTVRSRGVMEKCTFCVQRIAEARQEALKEGRALKGGDVVTACQQACPANAIIFGDVNESGSDIARVRNHPLGYHVLENLDTKPNVTYIAKLRNT